MENKEQNEVAQLTVHSVPDIVDPQDANICDGCE